MPLVVANGGLTTARDSILGRLGLRLELAPVVEQAEMWTAYLAGDLDFAAATVADFALHAPQVAAVDEGAGLRLVQAIGFDSGLAILAREGMDLQDLLASDREQPVRVAVEKTPEARWFLLNLLNMTSIHQDLSLERVYVEPAQDLVARLAESGFDACVCRWPAGRDAPEGYQVLLSGRQASRVISHGWASRADVLTQRPEVVAGIAEAFLRGVKQCLEQPDAAMALFAEAVGLPPEEIERQVGDVVWLSHRDAVDLFDYRHAGNLHDTWRFLGSIFQGYQDLRADAPIPPDSALCVSALEQLDFGDDPFYVSSRLQADAPTADSSAPGRALFSVDVYIHWMPGLARPSYEYDPDAQSTVAQIALLCAQFPGSRLVVTRHLDQMRKERAEEQGVLELYAEKTQRLTELQAEGLLNSLYEDFPGLAGQDRVSTVGMGWQEPRETNALSRRFQVEVLASD